MFCNIPENILENANTNCRWPKGQVIRWTIDRKLNVFSDQEYLELCRMAWQPWEAESGLRTEYVSSGANCVFTTKRIDGASGVLAQAELPCGNVNNNTQLTLWMDTGDSWANAQNPPGRVIDALRVLTHEIGHLLGIGHINHAPAIMNPSISDIRTILDPDIKELRDRYGDPSATPGPGSDCDLCDAVKAYIKKVCCE